MYMIYMLTVIMKGKYMLEEVAKREKERERENKHRNRHKNDPDIEIIQQKY